MNKPSTIFTLRKTGATALVFVLMMPFLVQEFHRLWHHHAHPHYVELKKTTNLHEHIPACPINDYQISQFNTPDMPNPGIPQALILTLVQNPHPRSSEVGFRVGYLLRAPPGCLCLESDSMS